MAAESGDTWFNNTALTGNELWRRLRAVMCYCTAGCLEAVMSESLGNGELLVYSTGMGLLQKNPGLGCNVGLCGRFINYHPFVFFSMARSYPQSGVCRLTIVWLDEEV